MSRTTLNIKPTPGKGKGRRYGKKLSLPPCQPLITSAFKTTPKTSAKTGTTHHSQVENSEDTAESTFGNHGAEENMSGES